MIKPSSPGFQQQKKWSSQNTLGFFVSSNLKFILRKIAFDLVFVWPYVTIIIFHHTTLYHLRRRKRIVDIFINTIELNILSTDNNLGLDIIVCNVEYCLPYMNHSCFRSPVKFDNSRILIKIWHHRPHTMHCTTISIYLFF